MLSVVRQASNGSCTGAPVDLTAASTYTLASNDFTLSGGDSYPNFPGRFTTREIMDQVVADYITAQGTIAPAIQGRINCTGARLPGRHAVGGSRGRRLARRPRSSSRRSERLVAAREAAVGDLVPAAARPRSRPATRRR